MKSQRIFQISLLMAFLIISTLVFVLIETNEQPIVGVGGEDGVLGGDFQLQSLNGDVSLSDFEGKVVVLYFGFLSCPEVCPASMGMMSQTLRKFDESEVEQIQPILVSIDPKRDTYEQISEFTEYFDPRILGVTGTPEQIDLVARNYGAHFEITESSETDPSDYAFRHSSRYYVIDQSGRLVDAMRHSTTANELAARIRTLI